ncbi:hypothetical protein MHYP_G00276700 [Metynnis hypsauchen]
MLFYLSADRGWIRRAALWAHPDTSVQYIHCSAPSTDADLRDEKQDESLSLTEEKVHEREFVYGEKHCDDSFPQHPKASAVHPNSSNLGLQEHLDIRSRVNCLSEKRKASSKEPR